jgi:hypothetical protein
MNTIGLDFEDQMINAAMFDEKGLLIKTVSIDLDNPQNNVNELYSLFECKSIIATSLNSKYVLIKNFNFNIKNSFFFKKAIKNQKDSIFFLNEKNSLVLEKFHKTRSLIQFFITTKDFLKKHFLKLSHINVDPDYVSFNSLSLFRFSKAYLNDFNNLVIVNIGSSSTTIAFIEDGILKSSNSIKIGIKKLKSPFLNDNNFNNLDKIEINKLLNNSFFKNELEILKNEIETTISFFYENKNKENINILFTGFINEIKNLESYLNTQNTHVIDIDEKILEKQIDFKKYAIAIGSAIDFQKNDSFSTQFRVDEFLSKRYVKKLAKTTIFSLLTILFLIFGFYIFSNKILLSKEKKLLSIVNDFEKKDLKEMNKSINIDENISVYEKIDLLSSKIKKEIKPFPFYLNTLNVSNFLKYLNNLDIGEIEIKKINYDLEKFPNLSEKNEPYLTKIQIEFLASDISLAREFHLKLLNDKKFINSSKDIHLDILNNCYKLTFYLKNNTGLKNE